MDLKDLELRKKQLEILELLLKSNDKELINKYLDLMRNQAGGFDPLQDKRVKELWEKIITYYEAGKGMKGDELRGRYLRTMLSKDKTNVDLLGLKIASLNMSPRETLKAALPFYVVFWVVFFAWGLYIAGGNPLVLLPFILLLSPFIITFLVYYSKGKQYEQDNLNIEKEKEDIDKLKGELKVLNEEIKKVSFTKSLRDVNYGI